MSPEPAGEGLFPVERDLKTLWRSLPLPREGEDLTAPCPICGARSYYTFLGVYDEAAEVCELDDQARRRFRVVHEAHDRGKHLPKEKPAGELQPPRRTGDYEDDE